MSEAKKNWLIISWRWTDHLDAPYGRLMGKIHGSYDDAVAEARTYLPNYSPIAVVGEITND